MVLLYRDFSCQYTNGMGLQLLLPFLKLFICCYAAYRHSMPCTRFVVDVIVLCCLVLFHLIPVIMNCSLLFIIIIIIFFFLLFLLLLYYYCI